MKIPGIKTLCCVHGCINLGERLGGTPKALCIQHYNVMYMEHRHRYGPDKGSGLTQISEEVFEDLKIFAEQKKLLPPLKVKKPSPARAIRAWKTYEQDSAEILLYCIPLKRPILTADDIETEDEEEGSSI